MSTIYAPDKPHGMNLHPFPISTRIIAYVVESVVIGIACSLLLDVARSIAQEVYGHDAPLFANVGSFAEAANITLSALVWLWMRVYCEMRGKATFGKKLLGIKPYYVGDSPTVGRVLGRNIWLVAQLGFMVYVWVSGLNGSWAPLESASSESLPMLLVLTCLFDQRNRTVVDRWARVEFVRA